MSKNNALVSIIIPAYNAEKFILRSVNSCLNQSYENIEIIVINDGSTDNTVQVLNAINDHRFKIFSQENLGVCNARNLGMNKSLGDYIFFLDADDEIYFDCIEKMVCSAQKNNADLVIGMYDIVDQNGNIKRKSKMYPEHNAVGDSLLVKTLEDDPLTYTCWAKLFHKRVLKDIWFVDGRRIHEDAFFIFEVATKFPNYAVINDSVYKNFYNADSVSNEKFSEKYFDIIYFREKKLQIIEEYFSSYLQYKENIIVKSDLALLLKMMISTDKEFKVKEKELINEIKKNKKGFIPKSFFNKFFIFIVTHNLYFIYKKYYKFKTRKDK